MITVEDASLLRRLHAGPQCSHGTSDLTGLCLRCVVRVASALGASHGVLAALRDQHPEWAFAELARRAHVVWLLARPLEDFAHPGDEEVGLIALELGALLSLDGRVEVEAHLALRRIGEVGFEIHVGSPTFSSACGRPRLSRGRRATFTCGTIHGHRERASLGP